MTRGEIRTLARALISQTDTANTDYTNTELDSLIEIGIRFLASLVKWPRDKGTWTTTQGTGAYTLPSDFIAPLYVDFGSVSTEGDVKPLDLITEAELRVIDPNWQDETTGSQGRPERAIVLDRETLFIHPRPDAESASKTLIMGYVYAPAVLGADGDTPELPVNYHDLIPRYVQYQCYMGKLAKNEQAPSLLSAIVEEAKLLQPVVTKEQELQRMFWGNDDMDDNDFDLRFT